VFFAVLGGFWTLFWTPIFRVNFAIFLAFLKLHFRGF
jgi:hypothetical protein